MASSVSSRLFSHALPPVAMTRRFTALIGLLLLLYGIVFVSSDGGIDVLQARIDIRTIGTAAGTQKLDLGTYYSVAIFRVLFNQPLFVEKNGTRCSIDENCGEHLFGLTRLICGRRLFESHPSSVSKNDPPLFLLPWQQTEMLPLVKLFDPFLAPGDYGLGKEFRAVLVLSYSRSLAGKRLVTTNLDRNELGSCRLQFLDQKNQNWKPFGSIIGRNSQVYTGTVYPVLSPADSAAQCPKTPRPAQIGLTESRYRTEVSLRLREALVEHIEAELPAHVAETTSLLEMRAGVSVKIGGLLKGLITPIIQPVADMFGSLAAGALTETIVEPVAVETTPILTEGITQGVAPFLVNGLVDNITPAVTEGTTDALIESLSDFLSDYVTDHMTPIVATEVTKKLQETLIKPTTEKISTEGAVRVARKLTHSLTHILPRSVGHSLVPTLVHTLTHAPIQDYYCYYCFKQQEYCQFCNYQPSQMYFAMYYTGFYSTYYSLYYTDQRNINVELVRKKETSYEDPNSFGAQE